VTLVVSGWAGTWQEARRRRKNPTGDMSFFAFRPFFGQKALASRTGHFWVLALWLISGRESASMDL